jgi:hypothetical protein
MQVTIELNGKSFNLTIEVRRYNSGGFALIAIETETGREWGFLTTPLHETKGRFRYSRKVSKLKDDEVCIQNWTENNFRGGVDYCRQVWIDKTVEKLSDVMVPTGKRVQLGYLEGVVYRISDELLNNKTETIVCEDPFILNIKTGSNISFWYSGKFECDSVSKIDKSKTGKRYITLKNSGEKKFRVDKLEHVQ